MRLFQRTTGLRRLLMRYVKQPVLFHDVIEGRPADPQLFGGVRDISPMPAHGLQDHLPFDPVSRIFQRPAFEDGA
jgi:hypothetical protein